ncbi:hypothetical protein ACXET9_07330 [Brachybacterium sp. DNPG3]
MTGRKPTVPGNLRDLQRQINRLATAPLGPVSVTGDEGSLRFYTGSGDTFYVDPDGAAFAFQGTLTSLTPHLEANAAKNSQQDGRLSGHDADVTRIDAKDTAQDGRLNGHDTTLGQHNTRITTAQSTADGAVSVNNTQNTTLGQHNTRITTAQNRADKGVADAATAQTRADDAYTLAQDAAELAEGAITPQQLSTAINGVQSAVSNLADRVLALEQWRDSLPGN